MFQTFAAVVALVLVLTPPAHADAPAAPKVELRRAPEGGIQPQAVVADGVTHMLYYKGDTKSGDLFYLKPDEPNAKPIRVNSVPGSAIAIGSIRGGQLAVGRGGRVHVAWNGARSRAEGMCYARLADDGKSFEPQRNLVTKSFGLDGGGTVAADENGRVYVLWHAGDHERATESERTVWLTKSDDDGKTFAVEVSESDGESGACACCSMKAAVDGDRVFALYRAAREGSHRGMVLLLSGNAGSGFESTRLDDWEINACPMSGVSMVMRRGSPVFAWENDGQIHAAALDIRRVFSESTQKPVTSPPALVNRTTMPGDSNHRKHPTLAVDDQGRTLVAWTEGAGWNKGGALAWQVFNSNGTPIAGASGRRDGVPVWSFPAAFWNGSFVIFY